MNEKKRGLDSKLGRAVLIFSVLVVLTCVMIFLFSSQDSTQSSLTSGRITGLLRKLLCPEYDTLTPQKQAEFSTGLSLRVRKLAHFSEYLLLAQFSFQLLLALPRPRTDIVCALGALVFAAFFAATDEFHQSFVPGRAMAAKDVLIDSLGALTGLLIALRVKNILQKRQKQLLRVTD